MRQYMLNKKEFAKILDISEAQYCRYENNTSKPSLEIALKVSSMLKMTVNDIWAWSKD
jgi:DNA-binding XRE family transcriptional regulator